MPLAPSAVRLLQSLPRDDDNPWVIAGKKPDRHLTDLQHPWRSIRAPAEFEDVRIHDLRHSFTSYAVLQGIPLLVVSRMFGHRWPSMTLRYAHSGDSETEAAAKRIGTAIARTLLRQRERDTTGLALLSLPGHLGTTRPSRP